MMPTTSTEETAVRKRAGGERIDTFAARIAKAQFWYLMALGGGDRIRLPFVFLNAAISIAIIGVAATLLSWPLIFPPVGATAFLIFSRPSTAEASPRSALLGHLFGAASGFVAMGLVSLVMPAASAGEALGPSHLTAAAIAMGLTSAILVGLQATHAPGVATALLVPLGLLENGVQVAGLFVAVGLLCAQGWVLNRLAGIYYPAWRVRHSAPPSGIIPLALRHDESAFDSPRPASYTEAAEAIIGRRVKPKRAKTPSR